MSRLTTYKAKRRFEDTPEPKPAIKKSQKQLIFVIHKHFASHLHYDLRLELDGVLKSWAVPKGLPIEKNEKRLAIMTEDHPYEYKNFYGVIPKGNYGAGRVEIWDTGICWANKSQENSEVYLRKALAKGHLRFHLQGARLNGEYSLVKLKDTAKDEWLLIKLDDHLAPKAEAFPKVTPMLAKLTDKAFNNKKWLFEIKWDGYRALAKIHKSKVKLTSRNDLSLNAKFPSIVALLEEHLHQDVILDGEIVAIDHQGQPDFSLLKGDRTPSQLIFYVFDLLYINGTDMRKYPLIERKEKLEILLAPLKNTNIKYCDHVIGTGEPFFKKAEEFGLEGIMAKKMDSVYVGKRSDDWLKIKISQTEEAVIGGFTQSKNPNLHFGALLLGKLSKDGLKFIGKVGTGFSAETMQLIIKKLKPLMRKKSHFIALPKSYENSKTTFVKPEIKCLVSFAEWTNNGLMRHPVFHELLEHKKK